MVLIICACMWRGASTVRLEGFIIDSNSPSDLRDECATVLGITAVPNETVLATFLALEVPSTLTARFLSDDQPLPALVALSNISTALLSWVGPPEHNLAVLGKAVNVLSPGVISTWSSSTSAYLNTQTSVAQDKCALLIDPLFDVRKSSSVKNMFTSGDD